MYEVIARVWDGVYGGVISCYGVSFGEYGGKYITGRNSYFVNEMVRSRF